MKTKKPISTVSFNTETFLKNKLDELTQAGILSWWVYMEHLPEGEESKGHFHVYAEPSSQVQTDDVRKEFQEFDPTNPDKPKGTLLWVSSKFDDWHDYALHDPCYLASKGLVKKYAYKRDAFVTADEDELINRQADKPKTVNQRMMEAIQNGLTFDYYVATGAVPVRYIRAYQVLWSELAHYVKSMEVAEINAKHLKENLLCIDGFEKTEDSF